MAHQNGVTGVASVLIVEQSPMEFEPLLQQLSHCNDIDIHPHGVTVAGANADVSIFTHDYLRTQYAIASGSEDRGLSRVVSFSRSQTSTILVIFS
nr:hypothetical protein [Marinicella sp. W31]MDC2877132.1 hypothetical protein [Marinicella sp. W31]